MRRGPNGPSTSNVIQVSSGSGPVFSARSSDGPLPGVELTETGESGPMTADLPLLGVLQSWPAEGRQARGVFTQRETATQSYQVMRT